MTPPQRGALWHLDPRRRGVVLGDDFDHERGFRPGPTADHPGPAASGQSGCCCSWVRWLRASRRICSCRTRSRQRLEQKRCQSRWTGNGRPHFGSAQVRITGSAAGLRRVMGGPRAWSKPDGQRIFAARHAQNPSRFKPMVIASEDHRTCPRLKIAPRAVSTAGFAARSGSEDRQLRSRSPIAVSSYPRKRPTRPIFFGHRTYVFLRLRVARRECALLHRLTSHDSRPGR
jgi:hypothetical protein